MTSATNRHTTGTRAQHHAALDGVPSRAANTQSVNASGSRP